MPDESIITSLFPDEVVTKALVRDVQLPYRAGTMALITLDNGYDHTRPNTFGPAGLLALRDALDQVADRSDIAAVGVTGKPFIFAAGGAASRKRSPAPGSASDAHGTPHAAQGVSCRAADRPPQPLGWAA